MDTAKVSIELNELFREVFGDDTMDIHRDMTTDDVAGWDPTRMHQLIIAIEAHFAIEFTPSETEGLRRVGDIIDLIAAKAN